MSDGWKLLVVFLFVLLLITTLTNQAQADYIKDLQRRVGQLEQKR